MTGPPSPRRAFAAFLVGMVLMQSAWILTMPAFRGPDEFDHVYKAAAVARGQWASHDRPSHGRGGIVTIPGSIVRAASPVCHMYKYVGHDNCFPIRDAGHGQVEVATAAATYNPGYYIIVGTLTRSFRGSAVDFAMRAISATLCALLVAWAAAVIARWSSTVWPLLVFSIGLTPVLVYSTAMAAPNGVTYASAALVWASLMGLARDADSQSNGTHLALPLTIGSVALAATHTTGSMWLALTAVVVIMLRPLGEWLRIFTARWRTWLLAACTIFAAAAACIVWIRVEHTNSLSTKVLEDGPFPWAQLPTYHMLWALQAIGAFPLRNEPAPIPVYVIWGILLIAVLVSLFRWGSHRERLAASATLAALTIVPTLLTVVSYRTESVAWQGRYSLPLWLGVTSLAGLALDTRRSPLSLPNTRMLFALLATAMVFSTIHVGLHEISHGPRDPAAAAIPGGMVLVGILTALGALAPLIVLNGRQAAPAPPEEQHTPTSVAS